MVVQPQTSDTGAHRIGRGSFRFTRVQTLHGADTRTRQHQILHTDQRTNVQGVPWQGALCDQQPAGAGCEHRRSVERNIREAEAWWKVGQDHRGPGMHGRAETEARF